MDPQPATERKQVLSDIEQSIQNALALFNSKDLGGGIDPLYVIDDPIVSLHDSKNQNEKSNSRKTEKPPPETDAETDGNQPFYDALPYTNIKMSHESVKLPFLENPIKHTIDEMQRVLNEKDNVFSPSENDENKVSPRKGLQVSQPPSPSQHQSQLSPSHQQQPQAPPPPDEPPHPSPEELLNLYSQDLGIVLTPNVSPRGADLNNIDDFPRAKQTKKEKKNPKKQKQPKVSKDKKNEVKKGKSIKSEVLSNHDIKMRELMNIYGCGDKMKKPKSDSTLGSKSGVSRNPSMKKLSSVNMSSKASSVALSRKTKKIKYKFTNDLDINFCEGDTVPLEKSSRLSTKRKVKQKASSIKPAKKQNLKRKLVGKASTEDVELKLSKSYQNPTRNRNYETYKTKSNTKDFDDNRLSQKKPTNPRPINRKQKDFINLNKKALSANNNERFNKTENITVLDAIPNVNLKENEPKNKSRITESFQELPSEKLNSFVSKQPETMASEKNQITLNKKVSEERRLNKSIPSKDYHSYKVENKESSDSENERMMEQPTFHYTLPTQSSRSKEVERFLTGHYQHLPFVIGQSTNKSHNLWVNIQEALSLIKHNIPQTVEVHSVHDKDSDRPMSVLSKLTSKSSKRQHQCPALASDTATLYDIPETAAEGEERWEDHPDCIQANLDPNYSRPRCSCLPQATLSYKKVLRQIFGGGDDSIDLNRARDEMIDHGGDNYCAELRKVLIAFTQEFEELNNKYEELLSDPNSSKEELARLEIYLETKEEEIREIIARINEVKELNERSRGDTHRCGGGGVSLEPYKSTTSMQL